MKPAVRKIAVVTGTRAEFGLLAPLMRGIAAEPALRLQVVATGAHLAPEFGLTWKAIVEEGFRIDRKVEMLLSSDTPVGTGKSMGLAVMGMAEALDELRPDLLVLLGDRYEILAAAAAALVAKVPVCHLHGGETTEGAYDESIRHAVTKLSHLHFTSTEAYRKRVIQLGEDPARVFNVGALGLDAMAAVPPIGKDELARELGIQWRSRNLLVTFHPATLDADPPEAQLDELLAALESLEDATLLFTMANADAEGRAINRKLEAFVSGNPARAKLFASLGQRRYVSALRHVDAVVGNSSSGILEAPSVPVATVNIGDRQKGRIQAGSVLDCPPDRAAIAAALERAFSPAFRAALASVRNPYGDGRAVGRILPILVGTGLAGLTRKPFHDIGGSA